MILRLASIRTQLALAFGRDARRLRRVARDPGCSTLGDIELLLRAHGVPERNVWAAMDRLSLSKVSAPLAWAFAMEYDGAELADMLMSSTADAELFRHVDGATGLSAT